VKSRAKLLLLAALLGGFTLIIGGPAQAAPQNQGHGYLKVVHPKPGQVSTNSASGCNMDVCINVTGSGLHVSQVTGTGNIASYRCTTFDVDVNYTTVYRSNVACGNFGNQFYGQWTPDRNFPDGAQMCVAFRGAYGYPSVVGYPCETIHS
jgi:hypothetical protein